MSQNGLKTAKKVSRINWMGLYIKCGKIEVRKLWYQNFYYSQSEFQKAVFELKKNNFYLAMEKTFLCSIHDFCVLNIF